MLKAKKTTLILAIISVFLLSLVGYVRLKYVLPILMYHSVKPDYKPGDRLVVTPQTFRRQMEFLKRHRYNVVPLQAAAEMIGKNSKIPARTIAITFDDGNRDNFTYVFPILKEYGFPATLFIIVNEVGRPQGDKLSWEQIKLMRDSGLITIASHSLGPEPLINITSDEALKREIFDSKNELEEKLGISIDLFAYPEGRFNDKIKALVSQAGYLAALSTNPGKNFPDDDIFALKRLRISENADNMFVFWVETSGYYNFMRERRHK